MNGIAKTHFVGVLDPFEATDCERWTDDDLVYGFKRCGIEHRVL